MLGDPVSHSLSPLLHRAAFAASGIPGTYEARQVDAAGMAEAVDAIRRGDLDGANVTMPHKALALELADGADATASRAGAVNTLVRVGARVIGHNTDVVGVRMAWHWGGLPADAPIVVLGAGGAAAAVVLALEGRNVTVAARRTEAAGELLERLGVAGTVGDFDGAARGAVVVNATPLGMGGEELPTLILEGASGLFDMAYGPAITPAVQRATAAGIPVVTGPDMLLGQAMASFRLWTGRPAPEMAMRHALEGARDGSPGPA